MAKEKFKYLRTKAGGLLTQRPRNLTASPAQAVCIKCLLSRKVRILSDRGIGSKSIRVHVASFFPWEFFAERFCRTHCEHSP